MKLMRRSFSSGEDCGGGKMDSAFLSEMLAAFLSEWSDPVGSVLVTGDRGSGKSFLANAAIDRIQKGENAGNKSVRVLRIRIADVLQRTYSDRTTSLRSIICRALHRSSDPGDACGTDRRLVVVMDNVDHFFAANSTVESAETSSNGPPELLEPSLVADFYDCVRGTNLLGILGCTRLIFVVCAVSTSKHRAIPGWIHEKLFDLTLRLEAPNQQERLNYFSRRLLSSSWCDGDVATVSELLSSRTGGYLYAALEEIARSPPFLKVAAGAPRELWRNALESTRLSHAFWIRQRTLPLPRGGGAVSPLGW